MKQINLKKLIRQDIVQMAPYVPVASLWDLSAKFGQKPKAVVKLDAGENQLGYSPKVWAALRASTDFNFYPDPEYKDLRQALAVYTGVSIDSLMVSSGSDELLDLLFRLVLEPGDKVINCPPTFGMYPVLTQLNRGVIVSVPRRVDFSLDLSAIMKVVAEDARVKVIVICSPNNPTGTVSSEKEIVGLLQTGKLVMVDEAYFEFSGESIISLVKKYPNLVVLRTLSKWAGLAGLRVGYGIMTPFLVQQLLKIKPPYNVNSLASVAGIAALGDVVWREKSVTKICQERKRLAGVISCMAGFIVYSSEANLLFIKVTELKSFERLKIFFEKQKIVVRYYDAYQAIRLSVGTSQQNDLVIKALRSFAAQKWDSVIFDMDGVLVDVSQSYRLAIKQTVEFVLLSDFNLTVTVQPTDIEAMKKIPGFNNDWDLSFALVKLLADKIQRNDFAKNTKPLTEKAKQSLAYKNIKDIFQSYYLGAVLFKKIYRRFAPIKASGLINNEKLLISIQLLKKLAKKYKLGIATSRPRFEALFTLKNLDILPTLMDAKNIVAQEDAPREKPSPDPLLKAQQVLQGKCSVYIGDSINDVLAARAADMQCIFIGQNDQANFQVKKTDQIKEILL